MGNHVGTELARLICARGYLPSRIAEAGKAVADAKATLTRAAGALSQARQIHDALLARRESVDARIRELSVIDPTAIRPARPTPRLYVRVHGAFIAEAVAFLQSAGGWIPTVTIIQHMIDTFDLPAAVPAQRTRSAHAVRRMLRALHQRGAIERLAATGTSCSRCWRWVGRA